MNRLSLFSIFVLTIFVSYSQPAVGQDSTQLISKSWQNLNTQLLRRADISINIAASFSRTKNVDKEAIDKIILAANNLKQFLDTPITLDSVTIQKAYQFNNNLSQAISSLLTSLIIDKNFKQTEEANNLQMQLEGTENRIMFAKRQYNDACNEVKRFDLIFGSTEKTKATQIRFR